MAEAGFQLKSRSSVAEAEIIEIASDWISRIDGALVAEIFHVPATPSTPRYEGGIGKLANEATFWHSLNKARWNILAAAAAFLALSIVLDTSGKKGAKAKLDSNSSKQLTGES